MPQNLPNHDLLNRWLNGETGMDAFEGHEDLKKVVDTTSRLKVPENQSQEASWEKLQKRMNTQENPVHSPVIRPLFSTSRVWAIGIAASLVMLVGLSFLFYKSQDQVHKTTADQTQTLDLPDGSSIIMEPGSEVRYNASLWKVWNTHRKIELQGEAFFDVTKGTPFTVKTPNGNIDVLGTRFLVYSRNEMLDVACHTGKVRVSNGKAQQAVLTPGLAVISQQNLQKPYRFDTSSSLPSEKGVFNFDNAPLNEVIAVLERQFDVIIEGSYPKDRMYDGGFSNEELDAALQMVFGPYGIPFTLKEGNRIILGEPAR